MCAYRDTSQIRDKSNKDNTTNRDTDISSTIQSCSLSGIKVINDSLLRERLRVGRSSLETRKELDIEIIPQQNKNPSTYTADAVAEAALLLCCQCLFKVV